MCDLESLLRVHDTTIGVNSVFTGSTGVLIRDLNDGQTVLFSYKGDELDALIETLQAISKDLKKVMGDR